VNRDHFILNEDHSVTAMPVTDTESLIRWAERWESLDRRVAATQVAPGVTVSTVFLGLDHNFFGEGPPLLFETMVFDDYGGGDCWRWSTWDEAVEGHKQAVAKLEESLSKSAS